MDTRDPVTIVRHWPFIERMLNFHRWESGRRALALVAQLQHEARGEFVELGPKRLREFGVAAGQTGVVWRALVDLESRRAVTRRRGAGRLPDSWGVRADLSHWRGVPWKVGALKVEQSIAGCSFCFANFAVASRNAGQERLLHLISHEFNIGPEGHLPEIGSSSRSYGDLRATNAKSPASEPVDSRDYGEGPSTPSSLSVDLEDLLLRSEGAAERHARLRKLVNVKAAPAGWVYPGKAPDMKLAELAVELTDHRCDLLIREFDARVSKCHVPSGVELLAKIHQENLAKWRAQQQRAQ